MLTNFHKKTILNLEFDPFIILKRNVIYDKYFPSSSNVEKPQMQASILDHAQIMQYQVNFKNF